MKAFPQNLKQHYNNGVQLGVDFFPQHLLTHPIMLHHLLQISTLPDIIFEKKKPKQNIVRTQLKRKLFVNIKNIFYLDSFG